MGSVANEVRSLHANGGIAGDAVGVRGGGRYQPLHAPRASPVPADAYVRLQLEPLFIALVEVAAGPARGGDGADGGVIAFTPAPWRDARKRFCKTPARRSSGPGTGERYR